MKRQVRSHGQSISQSVDRAAAIHRATQRSSDDQQGSAAASDLCCPVLRHTQMECSNLTSPVFALPSPCYRSAAWDCRPPAADKSSSPQRGGKLPMPPSTRHSRTHTTLRAERAWSQDQNTLLAHTAGRSPTKQALCTTPPCSSPRAATAAAAAACVNAAAACACAAALP